MYLNRPCKEEQPFLDFVEDEYVIHRKTHKTIGLSLHVCFLSSWTSQRESFLKLDQTEKIGDVSKTKVSNLQSSSEQQGIDRISTGWSQAS